jgi:ADP-ribose diphosphatase
MSQEADMTNPEPQLWERRSSEPGEDFKIFKVRRDVCRHPRTGEDFDRVVLEAADWVTVLPVTPEGEVLMVRQFRFGVSEVTIEVPAGLVDEGEEPLAAAIRELREETGYTSERWTSLGRTFGNPAFLSNRCHLFMASDARLTHPRDLDPGEDISFQTVPLETARDWVLGGQIEHPTTIAALARVIPLCEPRSS